MVPLNRIETWFYGLAAAMISSSATTAGALLTSAATGTGVNWPQLGVSVGVSAVIAGCLYLKQSPLPANRSQ